MSFRVKPTSKFLKPPEEKAHPKESLFSDNSEKKKRPAPPSGPKDGSSVGLAIRTVVVAQADHM